MTGELQFVSWSRRGVGAQPIRGMADSRMLVENKVVASATIPNRVHELQVNASPLTVLGPADVVGVVPTQVVRRTPCPEDHAFEPTHLAAIEFAHPDLPWMFSPDFAPDGTERLDPWLMLVAIDTDAGHEQGRLTTRPRSPVPVLVVDDATALPDPGNAWAFAHVQVHDVDLPQALAALQRPDPLAANVRSRVLCPTKLRPGHSYLAVLVPTYEAGRLAGLGENPAGAGVTLWRGEPGLALPVFDFWHFRTSTLGDFETLAKKLGRLPAGSARTLGVRRVAVEARAALMQPEEAPELFPSEVHEVPTAISTADAPGKLAPGSEEPSAQRTNLHRRLKELVDLVAAATDEDPIVGPPLYGRWPAEVTSLDGQPGGNLTPVPAGTAQTWIAQLNADPYLRTAAGLATRVVQHNQERLMADAWSQLADVVAANRRMRWAALFAAAGGTLHTRIAAASATGALRVAAPALGRLLRSDGTTVRATVAASTVPPEVVGSAFARAARFAVKAARRAPTDGPVTMSSTVGGALAAVNDSAPAVLPPRFTTPRAIDREALGEVLASPEIAPTVREGLGGDPAEYLDRITEVPATVEATADRFDDAVTPVFSLHVGVDGGVSVTGAPAGLIVRS